MLIYIAGVPGVGKTTIIKGVTQKLNKWGYKNISIRGLPILCDLADNISPEDFRKLPDYIREKYRSRMYKIIYNDDLNDFYTIRFLDGHFTYYEVGGSNYSVRKINKEDYKQMKIIFVILSKPQKILERRIKEKNKRKDRIIELEHIKKQQKKEVEEAKKQSKKIKIPIFFINNNKSLEHSVNKICFKIKNILYTA